MIQFDGFPPAVSELSDFNGEMGPYLDHLHARFKNDLIHSPPEIGRTIRIRKQPITNGKENTFWHLVSEGEKEEDREINLERCEKLCWIKPIIEKIYNEDFVFTWEAKRGQDTHILIALRDFSYVVIMADRSDYLLLKTAYPVERRRKRENLEKEYKAYKMSLEKIGLDKKAEGAF